MASGKKRKVQGEKRKTTVPRLPTALQKEIDFLNPVSSDEEDDELQVAGDIYEYEEELPEEETKKNQRFDPVENYEYELPDDFEDEDLSSQEDNDEEDDEDDYNGRHLRMLQKITGLPADAFDGRSRKHDVFISEAYPESEYNPSRDILEGNGRISIEDLLNPLQGKPGFGKLRKELTRRGNNLPLRAPLPKTDTDKVERKVAYEKSKEEITKWEPLVKRNREAPTIYFDEDTNVGYSTVGAIASEFEPRSDFERKMASLHKDIGDAHKEDGARLLELNKISIEEVKDQQSKHAKMRSLLFRHEVKAKRIKKIKSKTYHRMLKKDKMKETTAMMEMDPDAAKELAMKQEFKRAEERLTLKHKNSSKWAKRILQRGLAVQDDGTRAAISAQLTEHAILTRKMNSMKESSGESSDEDESDVDLDQDDPSLLLKKAKKRTLEVLEGDEEPPSSGVMSLPFMVRGAKKRKEEAEKEARAALDDYEFSLKHLEGKNDECGKNIDVSIGKRTFGPTKGQVKKVKECKETMECDSFYGNSDGEESLEAEEGVDDEHDINYNDSVRDVNIDPDLFRRESEIGHDSLIKSFEEIVKDPGPKTTYEVAIVTSNSRSKMKRSSQLSGDQDDEISYPAKTKDSDLQSQDVKEDCGDSDSDSDEEQMVDGILSSGPRSTYELPSQEELIRRAFAGDDVEEDFEKDKEDILNQENPEPEKPMLLPGWGQWTDVQKKKGLPSWMLKEKEDAKKKREEALKKRRDAQLKHVIISEKVDKKAEKLQTKTLPHPFKSDDAFYQSMRMPIGPEYNPATAIGALNRPEVVKKPGVNIKPVKREDINPHERSEDLGNRKHKHQSGKSKQRNKQTVSGKAS